MFEFRNDFDLKKKLTKATNIFIYMVVFQHNSILATMFVFWLFKIQDSSQNEKSHGYISHGIKKAYQVIGGNLLTPEFLYLYHCCAPIGIHLAHTHLALLDVTKRN